MICENRGYPELWYPGQTTEICIGESDIRIIRKYDPNAARAPMLTHPSPWVEKYILDKNAKCSPEKYAKYVSHKSFEDEIYYWTLPEEICVFQLLEAENDFCKMYAEFEPALKRSRANSIFGIPGFDYPLWFASKYPRGYLSMMGNNTGLIVWRTKGRIWGRMPADNHKPSQSNISVPVEIKYSDKRTIFEHFDYECENTEYETDFKYSKWHEYYTYDGLFSYHPSQSKWTIVNPTLKTEYMLDELKETEIVKNYRRNVIKMIPCITNEDLETAYDIIKVGEVINAINEYSKTVPDASATNIGLLVRRRLLSAKFSTWAEFVKGTKLSGPSTIAAHKLICDVLLRNKNNPSAIAIVEQGKTVVDKRVAVTPSVGYSSTTPKLDIAPAPKLALASTPPDITNPIVEMLQALNNKAQVQEPDPVPEPEPVVEAVEEAVEELPIVPTKYTMLKYNVVLSEGNDTSYKLHHYVVFTTRDDAAESSIAEMVYDRMKWTKPMKIVASQKFGVPTEVDKPCNIAVKGCNYTGYCSLMQNEKSEELNALTVRISELSAKLSSGDYSDSIISEMKTLMCKIADIKKTADDRKAMETDLDNIPEEE